MISASAAAQRRDSLPVRAAQPGVSAFQVQVMMIRPPRSQRDPGPRPQRDPGSKIGMIPVLGLEINRH